MRPEATNPVSGFGLRRHTAGSDTRESRQSPTRPAPARPLTATQSATHFLPDLAEVIDAWPELPEAIRAGILAMVRASSGNGGAR